MHNLIAAKIIWLLLIGTFSFVLLNSLNGGLVISGVVLTGTFAAAWRAGWRP